VAADGCDACIYCAVCTFRLTVSDMKKSYRTRFFSKDASAAC